jgi:putative DNA primase/helicase
VQYRKPDGSWVLKDGKPEKMFPQRRSDPDHKGKWIYDAKGVRLVPYGGLNELAEAIAADHDIYICEGEAKCELLISWNLAATCNSGGAGNWTAEYAPYLKDARVILVPDNDGAGWEHINTVAATLVGVAKCIRVLVLPDMPVKGDVIDWAKAGGTREKLDALTAAAHDWKALPTKVSDTNQKQKDAAEQGEKELLDALAKMPKGVAFARERKRLADTLGVDKKDIDAEIRNRRDEFAKDAPLYGHWINEPWPEPVDGDALLRDIITKIRKHVIIPHDYALACALWVVFAWCHDEATFSPILAITAADKDSGKSTLLKVISFLLPRCISTVDISRPALYRSMKRWNNSFAIDEFDTVLAAKGDSDKAELRAVLNAGHTRGDDIVRCITDDHTPETFPTFCPKVIGLIGRRMPATFLSRCTFVEVQRKKKTEQVQPWRRRDDSELQNLRSRCLRYSMDNAVAVFSVEPAMPEGFINRLADNWTAQFAIADLAGEEWGDQARAVARKIEKNSDSRSVGERLLAAIKAVRKDSNSVGIGSQSLVDILIADKASEWAEYRKGKPITQKGISSLLERYRIHPKQIRLEGEAQLRGYMWEWFTDAWERHL